MIYTIRIVDHRWIFTLWPYLCWTCQRGQLLKFMMLGHCTNNDKIQSIQQFITCLLSQVLAACPFRAEASISAGSDKKPRTHLSADDAAITTAAMYRQLHRIWKVSWVGPENVDKTNTRKTHEAVKKACQFREFYDWLQCCENALNFASKSNFWRLEMQNQNKRGCTGVIFFWFLGKQESLRHISKI